MMTIHRQRRTSNCSLTSETKRRSDLAKLKADEFLIMRACGHTKAVRARREEWERVREPLVASTAIHG